MNIMNTIKTIGVGTLALVGLQVQTIPTVIRCSMPNKMWIGFGIESRKNRGSSPRVPQRMTNQD